MDDRKEGTKRSLIIWVILAILIPFIGGWYFVIRSNNKTLRYAAAIWCVIFAIVGFTTFTESILSRLLFSVLTLLPALYLIDDLLEQKRLREEKEKKELDATVEKILSEPTMEELYLKQLEKKYEDPK